MSEEYAAAPQAEDEEAPGCIVDPATGMPVMDPDEADEKKKSAVGSLIVFFLLPRVIALAPALSLYFWRKAQWELRMTKLVTLIDGIGWLAAAGGVFCLLVWAMNYLPMIWKAAVFPGSAGNMRANMAVFKVQTKPQEFVLQRSDKASEYYQYFPGWAVAESKQAPYVMMETEGDIGSYNRANRAMYHFVENGMHVLVAAVLSGLVFGEAVFCLMLFYLVTRVWYQLAYANNGYGAGCCNHGGPFALHTFLTAHILEVLLWIAAIRMILIQYERAAEQVNR